MATKKCAYLTMEEPGDYVMDYDVSFAAMHALDWEIDVLPWRDSSIDWDAYDAIYICTPWDYPDHKAQFIDVLEQIESSSALLVNELSLVRWTMIKTYLRDLEQRGADIVPSLWYDDIEVGQIPSWFETHGTDKVVIKPDIGANAIGTSVLETPVSEEQIAELLQNFKDRPFFVQPFIENIRDEGEYSLFYFSGEYSHAILKVPKGGEFRVQEEYGSSILSVQPEQRLLESGQHVLSLVDPQPVYVRADFVRGPDGRFLLMELELIEPSLYLRMDDGAADRFAAAFDKHVLGASG